MLKQLLKRLQQREFTEQQEIKLLEQAGKVKERIEQNIVARAIEQAKLEEIKKDNRKYGDLETIDQEISSLQKKVRRNESKFYVLAILYTLSIILGTGFLFSLSATIFSSLVWAILSPILTVGLFIGASLPTAKVITDKHYKLYDKINELTEEKQALLDETKVDIHGAVETKVKSLDIPQETKARILSAKIVNSDENVTTV